MRDPRSSHSEVAVTPPWGRIALLAALILGSAASGQDMPKVGGDAPKAEVEKDQGRHSEPEKAVGHVTKIDAVRGAIGLDIGLAKGACVGLHLIIYRKNLDPKAEEWDRWQRIGMIELVQVDERDGLAKELKGYFADDFIRQDRPDEARRPKPEIRVGDEALFATDPGTARVYMLGLGDDPDAPRELARIRVPLARRRWEIALAWMTNSQITFDRAVEASKELKDAEAAAATTREGAIAAARAHLDRMQRLLERALAMEKHGDGSEFEVSEARYAHSEAALGLAEAKRQPADGPGKAKGDDPPRPKEAVPAGAGTMDDPTRQDEILLALKAFHRDSARRRYERVENFYSNGTITFNRQVHASRALRDADRSRPYSAAETASARVGHLLRMHRWIEYRQNHPRFEDGGIYDECEARTEHARTAWELAEARRSARNVIPPAAVTK